MKAWNSWIFYLLHNFSISVLFVSVCCAVVLVKVLSCWGQGYLSIYVILSSRNNGGISYSHPKCHSNVWPFSHIWECDWWLLRFYLLHIFKASEVLPWSKSCILNCLYIVLHRCVKLYFVVQSNEIVIDHFLILLRKHVLPT